MSIKPNLIQCDVRAATHVMVGGDLVYKIASKWGINEDGTFMKGGFGVVTETGERIGMLDARLYLREPPRMPDVLAKARELYEDARKHVAGRPKWEDLKPDDPYDMGMHDTAIGEAVKTFAGDIASPDQEQVTRWIDAWDKHRLKFKANYIAAGMSEEDADEKATFEVRMQIRRAPPLSEPT